MNLLGPISAAELQEMLPYGILTLGALFVLTLSFVRTTSESRLLMVLVTMGIVVACMFSFGMIGAVPAGGETPIVHDQLGYGFAQTILLLLLFVIPVLPVGTSTLNERPSLVYSMLLFSACGGLLMVYAGHLLVFFVGLELLSIPLYVLTGLSCDASRSTEAAFKYFLLGAIASALFIYGAALVWGGAGTMLIREIGPATSSGNAASPSLAVFGLALILTAIAFKIGLFPFQMWVADVYEGAPSTVVAWMAGAVKAAGFVAAIRFFSGDWRDASAWVPIFSLLAVASMLWGSFGALYQTQMKRLLGYSAIAHAGYAAIALVVAADGAWREAGGALAFYVLVYGLAALTVFIIVSIEEGEGRVAIADFNGLATRKPLLAMALAVSLFSLAGLPPLAGFIGKFNIFVLAAKKGFYGLVLAGVLTSVVSLAYYLRVIVAAYMQKPAFESPPVLRWATATAIGIAAVATILLGLIPGSLLSFLLGGTP